VNTVSIAGSTAPRIGDSPFAAQYAGAVASGDRRYQLKKQQLDRPGISRGRAHTAMAGIGAANDVTAGVADAYTQRIQRAAQDANYAMDNKLAQEQFAQALGGLQQQNAYAAQLSSLQRTNSVLGALGGLLR